MKDDPIARTMYEEFGFVAEEDEHSQLIKQIREHKIKQFVPAFILRKKGGEQKYVRFEPKGI